MREDGTQACLFPFIGDAVLRPVILRGPNATYRPELLLDSDFCKGLEVGATYRLVCVLPTNIGGLALAGSATFTLAAAE